MLKECEIVQVIGQLRNAGLTNLALDMIKNPFKSMKSFMELCVRHDMWATFLIMVLMVFNVIFVPLSLCIKNEARFITGDGLNYYAYLPSTFIDGDLNFTNDYLHDPYTAARIDYNLTLQGNVFAVGSAILSVPFFLSAHILTGLLNATGVDIAVNGYSIIYQVFHGLGHVIYAYIGLYLIFRILRIYYSCGISLASSLILFYSSQIVMYISFFLNTAHPHSMFAVSLFLYLYFNYREELILCKDSGKEGRFLLKEWALIGVAAGIMSLVRWQNAVFMMVPFIDFLVMTLQSKAIDVKYFFPLVFMTAVFALVFTPQMIVWHILYGSFLTVPQGGGFLNYGRPLIFHVLFSPHNGLFLWHPIYFIAFYGLFYGLRKGGKNNSGPGLFIKLLFPVFLIQLYLNGIVEDWWAAESFGMRRFINMMPFFAFGIAEFLTKHSWEKVKYIVLFFFILNMLLALYWLLFTYEIISWGGWWRIYS